MLASKSPRYYKPEIFQNLEQISQNSKWLQTEILWEAWLADTILLVADNLTNAVLTGGSGARNITQVYRLTYDVDFDTPEEDIEKIFEGLKQANHKLGGRRSLDEREAGLITIEPDCDVRASFRGPNHLAKFSRWTENGRRPMKLHIMNVSGIQDMLPGDLHKLETVLPIEATVRTAYRKYLFYRKSLKS